MRKLVASYFHVVLSTLKDLVPKIVMKFVVLHTEKSIHSHLIANLLKCACHLVHLLFWSILSLYLYRQDCADGGYDVAPHKTEDASPG
jgi:hypothetical protein